jgi:hypothetical protein
MNTKLALAAACVLLSNACVSTSGQYRNDIVYRDGSYYSPADNQNGDYYYAPEQDDYDYGYYADYYDNYYYDTYRSPWYGYSNNQRCRFSYRYDRYCSMFGRGGSALHFGGFTLIIGRGYSRDYGYDRGYYDNNYYAYGNNSPYYYSGYSNGYGSSYYNGYSSHYNQPYYYYSPRPHQPGYQQPNAARPMPKPYRPNNPVIDNSVSSNPGVRVGGEYAQAQRRIARLETPTETVVNDAQDQNNASNDRNRSPRQPGVWNNLGNNEGERTNNKRPVRIDDDRSAPIILWNQGANANNKQPVRMQPQPEYRQPVRVRESVPVIVNSDSEDAVPYIRPQRQEYRRQVPMPEREVELPVQQERIARIEQAQPVRYEQAEQAPVRYERVERPERVERVERREEPAPRYEPPAQEQVNNKGPRRVEEDTGDNR